MKLDRRRSSRGCQITNKQLGGAVAFNGKSVYRYIHTRTHKFLVSVDCDYDSTSTNRSGLVYTEILYDSTSFLKQYSRTYVISD